MFVFYRRLTGCFVLFLALWANVAIAAENGDFLGAAERGDLSSVTSSLAKGADINARNNNGQTALMLACSGGHKDVVQFLIAKGADVNLTTTAQIITAMKMSAGFSGTAEIYSIGSTALIFASEHGHKEVVQLLLSKGAKVNAKTDWGDTALLNASAYGHKEVVQMLLAKGADVNIKTQNGATALSVASRNGYHEIAELLTKAGAR
jgi:ankyrin repeat protein